MTGLEWPRPAIAVFHFTPVPVDAFQVVGVALPSPMPLAAMPRKEGQSTPGRGALAAESEVRATATSAVVGQGGVGAWG